MELWCWYKYFNGYKVCYVNYFTLWNFLIFFLLPPKTTYGPITGGYFLIKKNFQTMYEDLFFNFLNYPLI